MIVKGVPVLNHTEDVILVSALGRHYPHVSDSVSVQAHYVKLQCFHKYEPDAAFCYAAFSAAVGPRFLEIGLPSSSMTFIDFHDRRNTKITDHFDEQVAYWKMRLEGQSHNMAEMLALKCFPAAHGLDSTFMKGTHHQDSVLENYRYQAAAEAGVDTNGRRYISGLARFPNDPEAWVSGRADVLRVCSDRGWNCRGLVERAAPKDIEPEADIPIAGDIVQQHVEACLRAFPAGDHTPQLETDIREQVTKELSGEIELDDSPHVGNYSYEDSIRMSEA